MVRIRRALLSCHDTTGLDALAKYLAQLRVDLIASTGTAAFLRQHGLQVRTVEEFAGITEQLDGRVKTLHPTIYAGILALRDHPAHMARIDEAMLIDLVVVNLYPFQQTIQQPNSTLAAALEQIDVGGVALLRAAAKNFPHVAVVCQPQQYPTLMEALRHGHGVLPSSFMRPLALTAFRLTSTYDQFIAGFLEGTGASGERFPETVVVRLRKRQPLRYGENPHQQAAWYVPEAGEAWGLATLTQRQGKELSYNNLLDIDAVFQCLLDFDEPTCVMVKHTTPCGVASAHTLVDAYERAYACDPESAFGGVMGCNRPVDGALAQRLIEPFLEVVVSPSIDSEAMTMLTHRPTLRAITLQWPTQRPVEREGRSLLGSWLLQEPDVVTASSERVRVVTTRSPSPREHEDLLFAWKVVKQTKSNGIVIARESATLGFGQGQPSRVGAVRLAIQQGADKIQQAVCASEAFFPFPDSVELLAQAGVTAIIQPGGSIRDAEVIEAANRSHLAMCVTGVRHFRH
jgi:phosphoribosylaminoimidazolecarboxamide formyltransferase/IMP cyclohydrolase